MRLRRVSCAQALFASMMTRSALASIFPAARFSGAVLSVASVGIEDEEGTVLLTARKSLFTAPRRKRAGRRAVPGSEGV